MRLTTIVAIAAISLFSHTWADGMNYWIGPTNNSWDTADANWSLGYVPGADDTAVFTNDYRLIKIKSGQAASNVVFEAGSRVRFSRLDGGDQAAFGFKEFNGGGKLELFSTGLQANYASFAECPVSVSEIEIINDTSYSTKVSWFDGGSNEGSRMIVGSSVSGAGKLECRGNVTLAGETTATGSMKLDSGSVVKKLVYDNGGCNVTSDSAGTVEQVLVRGGTLAYSSSALAAATGVSVGSIVLDGGTIVLANDYSGDIQIGPRGGFIQLSFDAGATPVLPSGLAFVEDDNLDRVVVKAAVGEDESLYTISKSGGTYALVDNVCVWIDTRGEGDGDTLFHSASNWKNGNVPGADSLAYFGYNVGDVAFTAQVTVSAVVVPLGVSVHFRTANSADGGKQMLLRKGVFGAGTLVMKRFGFKSDAANVDIAVAKLKLPAYYTNSDLRDCWLMSSENYLLRVASDISGNGFLKIHRDVTFSGDNSGFTGSQVLVDEVAGTRVTFESADSYFTNAAAFNFGVADAVLLFEFQDGPAEIGNMNISNAPTLSQRMAVTGSGADLACFVPGLTLSNGGVCDLSAFTLVITNPEDLPSPASMRGKSLTLLSVPNGTLSGDVNVAGAPFTTVGERGRWAAVKGETTVSLTAEVKGLILVIR